MTSESDNPPRRQGNLRHLLRLLASPRLAFLLLVGLVAYVAAVSRVEAAWAYTNVYFLGAVALLVLSTAACAYRRTRRAMQALVSEPCPLTRVSARADLVLPACTADPLAEAARALRRLRMRVRLADDGLIATSNRLGLLGSPVFHWSLALAFAVAALGQATGSVGYVNIAEGSSKPDVRSSYLNAPETGPWFGGRFSRLDIAVERIDAEKVVGGIDHGATPIVALRSAGGDVVERGSVFPNSPLRHGTLTVHRSAVGRAAIVRIALPSASTSEERTVYFPAGSDPWRPAGFTVSPGTGAAGAAVAYAVQMLPDGDDVIVQVALRDGSHEAARYTLTPGSADVAPLPDGGLLRVVDVVGYARLGLVHDWSAPWLYLLFTAGIVAVALTVFMPPRAVAVVVAGDEVRIAVTSARNDPAFGPRVERALRDALARRYDAEVASRRAAL